MHPVVKRMSLEEQNRLSEGKKIPDIRVGDLILLKHKIRNQESSLKGIVIKVKSSDLGKTIKVLKTSANAGARLEKHCVLLSPNIGVELITRHRVTRNNLYNIRPYYSKKVKLRIRK